MCKVNKKIAYKCLNVTVFSYLCRMATYQTRLYTSGEKLPRLNSRNFFHSPELFHIIEKTPGQKPYMVVATNAKGQVAGHVLAIVRRRGSLLPPVLYAQGRVFGEGEYADDVDQEEAFGVLLRALTRKLRRELCFYIEFSHLSRKMFGYRYFRQNTYFPVRWQEVHNSLHSKTPIERISKKALARVNHAYAMGVTTREAANVDEARRLHKLIHDFYRFKPRRLIPPEKQFVEFFKSDNARLFVTLYKGKIIGGCVCAYSEGNAFLWYLASKRKRYAYLHPNTMTIWQAINHAWENNYAHFYFLDVGLPYPQSPLRDFILRFGGKPVSNYRWFRFSISFINKIIAWRYQE